MSPYLRDGMTSVETSIPKSWLKKIKAARLNKGMASRRQYIRDLIYNDLKREKEL